MAQCDVWRKKLLTELIIKKRFDPCLYHNSHNTKCQIQGPFFVVQKSAKLEQNYQRWQTENCCKVWSDQEDSVGAACWKTSALRHIDTPPTHRLNSFSCHWEHTDKFLDQHWPANYAAKCCLSLVSWWRFDESQLRRLLLYYSIIVSCMRLKDSSI